MVRYSRTNEVCFWSTNQLITAISRLIHDRFINF